jgi:hypothetical protein
MVLRNAMPQDVDQQVGKDEEYLPYPASPTSSSQQKAETPELVSPDPNPSSVFDSNPLNEVESAHPGITSQEGDNPWVQEAMNNQDNDQLGHGQLPYIRDNNFAAVGASSGPSSLTHSEPHNIQPPASPTMSWNPQDSGINQNSSDQTTPYTSKLQSNNPFLKAKQQNTAAQYGEYWDHNQTSPNYGEIGGSGSSQYQDGMRTNIHAHSNLCRENDVSN